MKDAKMLLLLQNEIGQIVGRRLTRSENNDETRELLEHVKRAFPVETDSNTCVIVSDNANSVRSMANVFGSSVSVRQAPFHVFQRFTEKVKDKGTSKRLARQLHETLYTVDEHLRVPSEMDARVQEAVSLVSPKEQAFQIDTFRVLRELNGFLKKRQLFVKVYDFASCVCGGVTRKSASNLLAT
ncbi:hypothetical protein PC128_g25268 [Phytophthora cactorum]|nr:hypothetical protein PC128_g25268 [Phytophthora cactorum]KAG4039256.1 hypothetical protein PC123_g25187 [Phytophthora cactorum]